MPGKVGANTAKPLGLPKNGKNELDNEYRKFIEQQSVSNNINSIQTNNENNVEQPAIVSNNINPEKNVNENNVEQPENVPNNNVSTESELIKQEDGNNLSKMEENDAIKKLVDGLELLLANYHQEINENNNAIEKTVSVVSDSPEIPVVNSEVAPPIIGTTPLTQSPDNTMKMAA